MHRTVMTHCHYINTPWQVLGSAVVVVVVAVAVVVVTELASTVAFRDVAFAIVGFGTMLRLGVGSVVAWERKEGPNVCQDAITPHWFL